MNSFATTPNIYIASDHAGFALKSYLIDKMREVDLPVRDMGPANAERVDYPDYARLVCKEVLASGDPGVLICGTGIGMSMSANRYPGIRAAVCTHEFHARACRAHNNANIICFGERVTAPSMAWEMLCLFLNVPFEGGRHDRRVAKIEILYDGRQDG